MSEQTPDSQSGLDATLIREAMAGYALANEMIESERQVSLAQMSRNEGWTIWRSLMQGFNQHRAMHHNLDRLDLWQVEGLVELRRALDLMAARQTL